MRKRIIGLIVIVIFFVLMICLPRSFGSEEPTFFVIAKGEGSKDISTNLENKGIVWWNHLFRAYVLVRGTSDKMQAGTYLISPSMSIFTIAEKFATGDIAKALITIPEGFTSEQIHQKLAGIVESDPIVLAEYEGTLFPDTYEIPYGMEINQVIEIMTDNFREKTEGLAITQQIMAMASILEKELRSENDKKIASGILWKRIAVGMPLQVDVYIWTYQNKGLPEKPICNPGLGSIKAALQPQESPYWYYLSKPNGETVFSKTLEEHNIARAKYLQ